MMSSFEERGKYVMAWRLSVLFSIVFSVLGIVLSGISPQGTFVYATIVVIALGILVYLRVSRKSQLAYWIYAISASILSQYTLNNFLDSAHHSDLLWILTTIIFAFVGLGRTAGISIMIFHTIGLGYYILNNLNAHYVEMPVYDGMRKTALFVEILLGFITLAFLLNQYLVFQSFSKNQLKKLNQSLEDQNETILIKNKENITLIKEVHHRVKNNLQIIISLLRMQRSEIKSEEAREQFSVAINRILTMSMIHQKLYQEKEPTKISMRDYLEDLINELVSLSNRRIPVKVNMKASDEYADLKTIVPFGLLVNELVANSMKHAFQNTENDTIIVDLKTDSEKQQLYFSYGDNGQWQEPDTEVSSFGLELIDILTEQMEGTYDRSGSAYAFTIPLDN